jgi:hypothetical protein
MVSTTGRPAARGHLRSFGNWNSATQPVNPFSDKDWAVTGVEAYVKVKAADCLATAEKLAKNKLMLMKKISWWDLLLYCIECGLILNSTLENCSPAASWKA